MTGWRLGYCMADAKLRDRLQIFHQYCVVSIPSFVQPACVAALQTDVTPVVETFRRRRDYVYQRLVDMGLSVQEPEGAFYMFIDIRPFGMDSLTFCEKMLSEQLIGLVPGIYFGTEGYMRLSYCYADDQLKEGLDRIQRFVHSLR
jgi:aminotransferase